MQLMELMRSPKQVLYFQKQLKLPKRLKKIL